MVAVENGDSRTRWHEGACFVCQESTLHSPAGLLDPAIVVRRFDSLVNERTCAAGFGLFRWDDGALMLGPFCILKLGALQPKMMTGFDAAVERAILGGLIARRPGGTLWYAARADRDELVLAAGLAGFIPRMPRPVFTLTQARMHRATIQRAVQDLAAQV